MDNIDVTAATRAGITVVNAPTGNTIAAAELTIGLLFAVARRLAAADASMRRGEWARSKLTGIELTGRTFGVVGFGKIGQAVASRARGLGMRVVASDPFLTAENAALHDVELLDLDALLASADVVSLHVPLTRSTRGLIGAAQLATMKRGAIVLNVARGGVVDEAALAAALTEGRLGGAGIDVYEQEPPPPDSPLFVRPERRPDAAPRRIDGRGAGARRHRGRAGGDRRARRPCHIGRGERGAREPGVGGRGRAVPVARGGPRRDPAAGVARRRRRGRGRGRWDAGVGRHGATGGGRTAGRRSNPARSG